MKFSPMLALMSSAGAAYFHLLAVRSASPIHYARLNANESGIWIGKDAAAYCPPEVNVSCASPPHTLFAGPATPNGTLALAVVVPGGQQIYVDPADGAVGYTPPHSVRSPPGALQAGWTYANTSAGFATLAWSGGAVVFCDRSGGNASDAGPWQMYAALPQLEFGPECLGAGLIADPASEGAGPAAWEYL